MPHRLQQWLWHLKESTSLKLERVEKSFIIAVIQLQVPNEERKFVDTVVLFSLLEYDKINVDCFRHHKEAVEDERELALCASPILKSLIPRSRSLARNASLTKIKTWQKITPLR